MCLILIAYRMDPAQPLIVAANRDEYYARPALAAHTWDDHPNIFAGRDIEARGTWLGVSRTGRFAAVTNWTQDLSGPRFPRSRGDLPVEFLLAKSTPQQYASVIKPDQFAGFNFISFDGHELIYTTNRTGDIRILPPGIYALTNTHLDDPWPKSTHGVRRLTNALPHPLLNDLIDLLTLDDSLSPIEDSRNSENVAVEQRNSPSFIRGDIYGTRASTAVILEHDKFLFCEQAFESKGLPTKRIEETVLLENS